MTVQDVQNLRVCEFEELLEGMDEYSDEINKHLDNNLSTEMTGDTALQYLLNQFGK